MDTTRYQLNSQDEIDLVELFKVLWSKAWTIILAALICGTAGGLFTHFMITPQYRSSTSIYVLARQNQGTLTYNDLTASSYLTQDYAQMIKSRTVAENVITQLALEDITPEKLLRKVTVSTQNNTRIITISVLDSEPEMAMKMADAFRVHAAYQIQKVTNSEAVNVVDTANLPTIPYSPSLIKNTVLAALAGAALAAFIVVIVHIVDDSIKTEEDIEKYLGTSTLGTIPLESGAARTKKTAGGKKLKAGREG